MELVGEDVGGSILVEEKQLRTTTHEYSSKNKCSDSVWMMDSIGQTESGSPGSSKDKPSVNSQKLSQLLNVPNQRLCVVILQLSVGSGLTTTSLVHLDDSVLARVKIPPVLVLTPTSRTSMKHHHWETITLATLLPVNCVEVRHFQHPGLGGLQGGIQNIIQSFVKTSCHFPLL